MIIICLTVELISRINVEMAKHKPCVQWYQKTLLGIYQQPSHVTYYKKIPNQEVILYCPWYLFFYVRDIYVLPVLILYFTSSISNFNIKATVSIKLTLVVYHFRWPKNETFECNINFTRYFPPLNPYSKRLWTNCALVMSVILVMIGGYISAISTMCPIIGKNLKNLTAQKEFSIEFTHNIPRWEISGFCILSFCQNERI